MTERRWIQYLPLMLTFALLCWVYAPVLSGRSIFAFEDFLLWYSPARMQIGAATAALEIAEWDPWWGLGSPLAYNPGAGALYPLNFLGAWPDVLSGLHRMLVLHFFIGAAGVFFLARRLNCTRIGSALAAASFAFAGPLTSAIQDNPYQLTSMSWIPWAAYFLVRAFDTGRYRFAFLAGGPLALALLKGEPLVLYFAMILMLALAAGAFPTGGGIRAVRRLLTAIVIAFSAGIILALPQLVSTLIMLTESARGEGFTLETRQQFSFAPLRILTWVYPYATGMMVPDNSLWGNSLDTGYRYTWSAVYAGLAPVFFGAVALASKETRKLAVALCVAFLVALSVALGRHFVVHALVDAWVPGVSLFRYPEKWLLAGIIPLSLLGALGFDRSVVSEKLWKFIGIAAGLFAIFSWAALALHGRLRGFVVETAMSPNPAVHGQAMARIAHEMQHGILVGAVVLFLCAGIHFAIRRKSENAARVLVVALALFVVGEHAGIARQAVLFAPRSLVEEREIGAILREIDPHARYRRLPVIARQDEPVSRADYLREQWQATGTGSVYSLSGWSRNINVIGPPVLAEIHRTQSAMLRGTFALQTARRSGIRFYLVCETEIPSAFQEPLRTGEFRIVADSRELDVIVIEDTLAFSRARIATVGAAIENSKDAQVLAAAMAQLSTNPLAVVVDANDALAGRQRVTLAPPDWSGNTLGELRWIEDSGDEILLEVESDSPTWVVLADAFAPGWSADVGGEELPIFRVDGNQRGVLVPAGKVLLRFSYQHPGLRPAATFALPFWSLWLIGIFQLIWRRPSRENFRAIPPATAMARAEATDVESNSSSAETAPLGPENSGVEPSTNDGSATFGVSAMSDSQNSNDAASKSAP